MTCKDCIHDGVCHLQEMSIGLEIEEYIKEFGCEDYISNTDLVRVVRCKDCNFRGTGDCSNAYYVECEGGYVDPMEDEDFCSYGERKMRGNEV